MKRLEDKKEKSLFSGLVCRLAKPCALFILAAFMLTRSVEISQALESGADFLNMGAGARASALGSAYTALANDPYAAYYNPAGLNSSARGVSLMHSGLALDGSYDFAAAAFPLGRTGVMAAVSFARLDHGSLDGRAASGESSGGFSATDKYAGVSFGCNAGGAMLGAGAKIISSDIAGYSASSLALDLGAMKKLENLPLNLGLAVRNIGKGLKFLDSRDPLPLSVSAGAALAILPSVNMAAEVSRMVRDRRTTFSIGSEYGLSGGMFLRGGYAASGGGLGSGMSGGIGFRAGTMSFDYSFSPFGEIDSSRRFSVTMAF